ncbi:MAG: class I SAM-dependent methyltransferase [Cyanobacteriota bacterium]
MSDSSASDFEKISPTALLVAYVRQFSGIAYTREIVELTRAEETARQFESQGQQQPVVAALIEARYKALEQVRTQFKGTQILELASGLLPRGLILSEDPGVIFIESDLPEMIQQKQRLVQQLVGERSNLHFLAIDATNNLNSRTLSDYFQLDKPVTVLCEGLLMYLTFPEKQQVFANVREILQTYGGVWITSDFTTKGARQMVQNDSALRQVNQKISSSTGRRLTDNDFEDLDHAKQFAQEQGFQVETFSMLDVVNQLESVSVLKINLDHARELLAATPIFALTLAL